MRHRILATLGLGSLVIVGALSFVINGGAFSGVAAPFSARTYQRLSWSDLKPPPSPEAARAIEDLKQRIDRMTREEIAEAQGIIEGDGESIVTAVDGRDVTLEGFLVPIDFDADRTSEFLLVSFYGACIHVPPPPPNQIVFVTFREGLANSKFESQVSTSFRVSGRIRATPATTDIADVGYQLMAHAIEKL